MDSGKNKRIAPVEVIDQRSQAIDESKQRPRRGNFCRRVGKAGCREIYFWLNLKIVLPRPQPSYSSACIDIVRHVPAIRISQALFQPNPPKLRILTSKNAEFSVSLMVFTSSAGVNEDRTNLHCPPCHTPAYCLCSLHLPSTCSPPHFAIRPIIAITLAPFAAAASCLCLA